MALPNKINISAMTTRALRARRRRLARSLPDVEGLISGSVVEQGRRCGKEGCRCARGELHGPYPYVVRRRAVISLQVRGALEEISRINIELLARGELA